METGLLGLISFLIIVGLYIYRGLKTTTPSRQGGTPLLSQEGNAPQLSQGRSAELQSSPPTIGGVPAALSAEALAKMEGGGGGINNQILKLSIALFLIALITQGLIDNPYFKNDLALVFWIILSLAI